jgi:phage terminase large subunit-like protein
VSGWSFACPDWEDRLRAGRSLLPTLPLDAAKAQRAVSIFNKLRLPDVPGRPALGEAAAEWQRDIPRAVFGSLGDDGVRRVQEVFSLVPKKNSKTTAGAAIMLTALLVNERPRAEFALVGPTQEIADRAFVQAQGMIEADPDGYLQKRFHVRDWNKSIQDRKTKARLKIKTFDMKVATGSGLAGVLLDELHLMSSMHFASRVIRQLRGGMAATPEAFLIFISTQSDLPPAGAFKAELEYARAVRDGRVKDGRTLPLLYEFPEAMQLDPDEPWRDERNWPMVLPNLGRSISIEWLRNDFAAESEKGEEAIRIWASQHLNIQVGMALHADRWRGTDYWLGAEDETITFETMVERCDVVVIGIDGGGLDDLLGLTAIGRDATTREWLTCSRAWCQDDVLKLRKDIAETLRDFAADGDLVLCTEPTQDLREVADICAMFRDAGKLPEKFAIGLDPAGVSALVDELAARGLDGDMVTAVLQGYRLSGAVWGAERKLKDGTLWHARQRMMNWAVANAKVEQKGNAVLITKQASGRAKIDPLVALFDAVTLMSRNPEPVRARDYQMMIVG